MPSFDFDTPIDRGPTSSTKWSRYRGRDIIPLWVADMDFRCAPAIVAALRERVEHGVFGYTEVPDELPRTIVAALERDHGWRIQPDWIIWLPSLVVGLNVVCRAFADAGDDVLTSVPVYPPFLSAPRNAYRNAVCVALRESRAYSPGRSGFELNSRLVSAATAAKRPGCPAEGEGVWEWDMDALDAAITPRSRLLLLCSPHNPTGRVWTRAELEQLACFALRHQLTVVSDEIHCGLVLDEDKRHIPFAALGDDAASRTVTLMSASKTFNTPTLGCAFAIASNAGLRARLKRVMAGIVHHVGGLGYSATLAAYRDGKTWQLALLDYLRRNRALTEAALREMPGIRSWHAEATYLAWIDARASRIENPIAFFESKGVGLHDGALFGAPGFLRLNFGCPRALLEEALRRMRSALDRR